MANHLLENVHPHSQFANAELPLYRPLTGVSSIGATTCYDVGQESARQLVIERWNNDHPHIVRIIGALPPSHVVKAIKRQLLNSLSRVDVGAVLIGGTETLKKFDQGENIDSIPGLALKLQSLSYHNPLHGRIADVYGTVPIGPSAVILNNKLDLLGDLESTVSVKLQKGLKQALIFPTSRKDIWNVEAEEVVRTVDLYLAQNDRARYSVIIVGGGKGTELEYQETQAHLTSKYSDRVQILPYAGSGGVAEYLVRKRPSQNITVQELHGSTLYRSLSRVNRLIPQDSLAKTIIEENSKQLHDLIDSRIALKTLPRDSKILGDIIAMSSRREHSDPYLAMEKIIADILRSQAIGSTNPISSRLDRLQIEFRKISANIQSLNLFADSDGKFNGQHAATLLQEALTQINKKFLGTQETSSQELNSSNSRRTIFNFDPLHAFANGQIVEAAGNRLAIITDLGPKRSLIGIDAKLYPMMALAGVPIQEIGIVGEIGLRAQKLALTPEVIPAWTALELAGGIVRYKNSHGQIVKQREILKLEQARDEEGHELPLPLFRYVHAIDSNPDRGYIQLVRRTMSVEELIFPPADIANATQVEVFPYLDTHATKADLPPAKVDWNQPSRLSRFLEPIRQAFESTIEVAKMTGIQLAVQQVQHLSDNLNEQNLHALTVLDVNFEQLLKEQRKLSETLDEMREVALAFVQDIALVYPQELLQLSSEIQNRAIIDDSMRGIGQLVASISGSFSRIGEPRELLGLVEALERRYLEISNLLPTQPLHNARFEVVVHRGYENADAIAETCAEIVSPQVVPIETGERELYSQYKSKGGISSDRYTAAYFETALSIGGEILELRDKLKDVIVGFALHYPPEAVTDQLSSLHPILNNNHHGYYGPVSMKEGAAPETGSLMVLRAALISQQYSNTDAMVAIIHQYNEASMKSALRDRFEPVLADDAHVISKQVGNGLESQLYPWKVAVNPAIREPLESLVLRDKRQRLGLVREIQSQGGGFLHPTQEEFRKMKWVAQLFPESTFFRFSLGVASMTETAQADLRYLVEQGTFDGLKGVFCLASTREATYTEAGWHLNERGPYQMMEYLRGRFDPESYCLGIAVSDGRDRNFGKTIEVLLPDGNRPEFPISFTETEDGTKVTVIDRRKFSVVNSPITFPDKYQGNLGIFHLEQLRAEEFAGLFKRRVFIYGAGGGVNAWDIERLTKKIDENLSDRSTTVLLITGLGGSPDRLTGDLDWKAKNQRAIDCGLLQIINPIESEEQRLRLKNFLIQAQ
jgi:hypothetical protein